MHGLRLALTTFTVLPVRAGRIDRDTARSAMYWAPVVGAALGAVLGLATWGLRLAGLPPLVGAAITVGLGALFTRGLHLDGLADTVDGLGSYASRERALEIMKKPDVGPFGVVAIVLTLLIQVAAISALPSGRLVAGLAIATATGRLAVTWACRAGVPSARPDGLGALVAGTTKWVWVLLLTLALAVGAPLAVACSLLAAAALTFHCVRRFGGVTGDVLGACVEVAATAALVLLLL
ncbi:adenosylcobinamide-GDP ribazoletransferase [Longispora albida]|uniref:adenosylcobinamide-GDP ribazoletransferase n=1 Tax=Longispora albida TaxID=203523 RepID=UPI0003630948|nr:adenosylcobinamide-GDP ribazoletransferase [Longispora albida]